MIEPIGHHDLAAVTACSGARYVATPSDQASRGVPPRCAPHPMCGCEWRFRDELLHLDRNARSPALT